MPGSGSFKPEFFEAISLVPPPELSEEDMENTFYPIYTAEITPSDDSTGSFAASSYESHSSTTWDSYDINDISYPVTAPLLGICEDCTYDDAYQRFTGGQPWPAVVDQLCQSDDCVHLMRHFSEQHWYIDRGTPICLSQAMPFHYAFAYGVKHFNKKLLKWLKASGFMPTLATTDQRIAVWLAVLFGSLDALQWLLKSYHCKIDRDSEYGEFPPQYGAFLETVVHSDKTLHPMRKRQQSLLCLAIASGNRDLFDFLEKEKCSLVGTEVLSGRALMTAISFDRLDLVKHLCDERVCNLEESDRLEFATTAAARTGDTALLYHLVSALHCSVPLNHEGRDYSSAVEAAAAGGHVPMLEMLVKRFYCQVGPAVYMAAIKANQFQALHWLVETKGTDLRLHYPCRPQVSLKGADANRCRFCMRGARNCPKSLLAKAIAQFKDNPAAIDYLTML